MLQPTQHNSMKFTQRKHLLLLQYIESLLATQSEVSPKELVEQCGIGRTKASALMQEYRAVAPLNVRQHDSQKKYVVTMCFTPVYLKTGAKQFKESFERVMKVNRKTTDKAGKVRR